MEIEIKTYLSPTEYESVKGINLGLELSGTSDHPDKDAELMIFRVEQNVINYLTTNYAFEEQDILKNEFTEKCWKLGICDQIEHFINNGLTTISSVEDATTKEKWLCESAKSSFRRCGFLNVWRY